MTTPSPALEDALDTLVTVATRRGSWLVTQQTGPDRPREAARLAAELEMAKRSVRALFADRVLLREVTTP